MIACIAKVGGRTYCDSSMREGDFYFRDADRAMKVYDERFPQIRKLHAMPQACAACCDAVKKEIATENIIR